MLLLRRLRKHFRRSGRGGAGSGGELGLKPGTRPRRLPRQRKAPPVLQTERQPVRSRNGSGSRSSEEDDSSASGPIATGGRGGESANVLRSQSGSRWISIRGKAPVSEPLRLQGGRQMHRDNPGTPQWVAVEPKSLQPGDWEAPGSGHNLRVSQTADPGKNRSWKPQGSPIRDNRRRILEYV